MAEPGVKWTGCVQAQGAWLPPAEGSCEGAADMAVERLDRTRMWQVRKIEPTSFQAIGSCRKMLRNTWSKARPIRRVWYVLILLPLLSSFLFSREMRAVLWDDNFGSLNRIIRVMMMPNIY